MISNAGDKVAAIYEHEDDKYIFIFDVKTQKMLHFLEYFGLGMSPDLN
jgi:hypothetical protein